MAEHTPGPWEVVEATEHHGFYVTSDFGTTICDLYTMTKPRFASTANGGKSKPLGFMHEMDGPNARLIAAAPELLEACQAMQQRIIEAMDLERISPAAALEEMSAIVDTAIKKATQP